MAKILFRLGLDAGFFRIHYDLPPGEDRRRLAGTIALFSAASGGALFALVVVGAPALARALLGGGAPASWIVLAAADVYLGTFAFVPLSLLRIQERPGLFSALSMGRHALNTALKVGLLATGHGVTGVLWSDLVATGAFALALAPITLRQAAPAFSWPLLRQALGFGLPKVPHGLLVQVQNLADRKILDVFVTRAEVGIYQLGYGFGTLVKFPLSAFEPAWQPFVYARLGEPDAPVTLARVAGVAFAAFAGMGLAVAVLGPDLVVLMTPGNPAFRAAAHLVPVVALAYVLHGLVLLTSIGIGVRKQARYYPLITAAAAATNVAANLLLIPPFGILGAAWATVLSYAVMAALGLAVSQRLYPLPLEWDRFARIAVAAAVSYLASLLAPAAPGPALAVKGAALAAFPALIAALGVLRGRGRELRAARDASRASPPE